MHPEDPALIGTIIETWRTRMDLLRSETRLTLQLKAICRRLSQGDKDAGNALYNEVVSGAGQGEDARVAVSAMVQLLPHRDGIRKSRAQVEKRLVAMAEQLRVAPFVEATRGFGLPGLAGIVGESGDLGSYSNPSKLWKRMGVAVIRGERQRRVAGDADLAIEHGYNAERRSLLWNIGESLVKAGGYYYEVYRARKEYEVAKAETAGLQILPAAEAKKVAESRSKQHVHNRARRYAEKCLLRDLWCEWNGAEVQGSAVIETYREQMAMVGA